MYVTLLIGADVSVKPSSRRATLYKGMRKVQDGTDANAPVLYTCSSEYQFVIPLHSV